MKRYNFVDDSYYTSSGCDCCEGLWTECYNLDTDSHPEVFQNGSAHSIDECLEQVLEWEGILEDGWRTEDMNWEEESLYLDSLMEENGLQVAIDFGGDKLSVYP